MAANSAEALAPVPQTAGFSGAREFAAESIRGAIRFLLVLLAYSLVLGQSVPIATLAGRPVMMSLDYALIATAVALYVVHRTASGWEAKATGHGLLFGAYTAVALLTFLASVGRLGFGGHVGAVVEYTKWLLYSCGIALPATLAITEARHARRLLWHMGVAAAIAVVVGYSQLVLFDRTQRALVGTFAIVSQDEYVNVRNSYAVYLAGVTLTGLAGIGLGLPLGGAVLSGFSFLLLVYARSRSAFLALAAGIGWILYARWHARRAARGGRAASGPPARKRRLAALTVALLIAVSAYLAVRLSPRDAELYAYTPLGSIAVLGTLLNPTSDLAAQNPTVVERLVKLQEAAEVFQNRPLLGTGFRTTGLYYADLEIVDNYYAAILLQTGLIGLLLVLGAGIAALAYARACARRSGRGPNAQGLWLSAAFGASCVALLVASIAGSYPEVGRLMGSLVLLRACTRALVSS